MYGIVNQGLHRTAGCFAVRIEDRQDVGMLEAGGDLDLPDKALGAERMRQLLVQDLEGDRADRAGDRAPGRP